MTIRTPRFTLPFYISKKNPTSKQFIELLISGFKVTIKIIVTL
ncbi:MAG: hypothetical protein OIN84_00950 [Candidatus Methanoperedens sp.]|nr:hypothetical protein [Candidatus Methanoperedens sp.]